MTDLKPVFLYKPVRAEKRKSDGSIIEGEYVGKFRTKAAPNTQGAFRHVGENAAGKKWDFWAVDIDSVNGQLRWIDCREGDYGATIELFLETPKSLRQLTIPFEVVNLHDIMNHLCGLGKEVEVAMLNISHWVRPKTDKDGNLKLGDDKKPIWKKSITFRDIAPQFSFDEWKAFAAQNGLEWLQEKKIGKTEWNFQAELAYWLGRVVQLQRFLLNTEKVLPFCWNSMTAMKSDGTALTLTEGEIATLNAIYEGVKPLYKFPFARNEETADDFEERVAAQHATIDTRFSDPNFPTDEAPVNHENVTPDEQPLPF